MKELRSYKIRSIGFIFNSPIFGKFRSQRFIELMFIDLCESIDVLFIFPKLSTYVVFHQVTYGRVITTK